MALPFGGGARDAARTVARGDVQRFICFFSSSSRVCSSSF
jgi:hypothetical protein